MKNTPTFEHKTCGRCDGSGNFSYNAMHGTRCYGCGGSGFVLTKRGKAAQEFLNGSRSRRVADLSPGDFVFDPFLRKFSDIVSIVFDDHGGVTVQTTDGVFSGDAIGFQMRCQFSAAEMAKQVASAIRFQGMLNADGSMSKRCK